MNNTLLALRLRLRLRVRAYAQAQAQAQAQPLEWSKIDPARSGFSQAEAERQS